jgi:hypothetical protein
LGCLPLSRTEAPVAFQALRRASVRNNQTEAVNALIKKVKKVRHGFRNLDNYGSGCCSL